MRNILKNRTPEDIKKGMWCCMCIDCPSDCPYINCDEDCNVVLNNDAIACIKYFEDQLREATKKIAQLERERDAAVACIPRACGYCKHFIVTHNGCTPDYDCARAGCTNISGVNTGWEWRGVQEVST